MNLDEFIAAIGGNDQAAARFGVARTTPYTWLRRGLPTRLHVRALRMAQQMGLDFDPETAASAPVPAPTPAASRSPARTTQRGPLAEVAVSPASASTPIASPCRIHEQDHDGEIGT